MPVTPLSTDPRINALLSTFQWGTQNGQAATVTYSFPGSGSVWASNYGIEVTAGWSGLNAAQRASFRAALGSWADVANLNFVEVADNAASSGQIRVAFSNHLRTLGLAGHAYFPTSAQSPQAGDIWLNPDRTDYSEGGPYFSILQHEVGHALGLKHPFETVRGNNALLAGAENSTQYTIMAYDDYEGAGRWYTALGGGAFRFYVVQPSTLMLYDIAAIQFLYGANMSTRAGNDVYQFSNTQGELRTIWDAGGVDTFDLSNQTLSQSINLNAGQFSSLGVARTSFSGPLENAVDNVAIAFGVVIEHAIGGAGGDTIIGNAAHNNLTGGAGNDLIQAGNGNDRLFGNHGNDTLHGGLGNDRLDGGPGNDRMEGGPGHDLYWVNATGDVVVEQAAGGTDTVMSAISWTLGNHIERLVLQGNRSLNATGNSLANTLTGNNAANILIGGAGNDLLIGRGGADNLTGGEGRDTFLFDSLSGVDSITDFAVAFDAIHLENSVFTSLSLTGALPSERFVVGTAASDGNDHLIYDRLAGALFYDADGSGAQPQTQIATLGANLALAHSHFWVV